MQIAPVGYQGVLLFFNYLLILSLVTFRLVNIPMALLV